MNSRYNEGQLGNETNIAVRSPTLGGGKKYKPVAKLSNICYKPNEKYI